MKKKAASSPPRLKGFRVSVYSDSVAMRYLRRRDFLLAEDPLAGTHAAEYFRSEQGQRGRQTTHVKIDHLAEEIEKS